MGQPHAVIKFCPQHLLYIQAAGSNTILDLEWYSREVMPFHGRKFLHPQRHCCFGSSAKSKAHESLVTTRRNSTHVTDLSRQLWNSMLKGYKREEYVAQGLAAKNVTIAGRSTQGSRSGYNRKNLTTSGTYLLPYVSSPSGNPRGKFSNFSRLSKQYVNQQFHVFPHQPSPN